MSVNSSSCSVVALVVSYADIELGGLSLNRI